MFKRFKKEARSALIRNYKFFIIPVLFYILSKMAGYLILQIPMTIYMWHQLSDAMRFLFFALFLILEFVCVPISVVILFRVSITIFNENAAQKENSVKRLLNLRNIIKIFAINFLPRLVFLIGDISSYGNTQFNIHLRPGKPFLLVISIISIYTSYKALFSNYHTALKTSSIKDTLIFSFKTMNKKGWKILLLSLSFIPWFLLEAVVFVLIKSLIVGDLHSINNSYTPFIDVFKYCGFGVDFYFLPYFYLCLTQFIDNLRGNQAKQK